jgi:hypothetical protein
MTSTDDLRTLIYALNHHRTERFDRTSSEDLDKMYNGCGAYWMPPWSRKLLTNRFKRYEAAFLIHDYDYSSPEFTRKYDADRRLYWNCKRIAQEAPWYIRPFLRLECWMIYSTVK